MASANWLKSTTQKAGAMKRHLGQNERENCYHSNTDIDKALSHRNYAIGCSDYSEALEKMKERTKEVDKIIPPKRVRKDRVTCCFIEIPCPDVLTQQGKSDEFFRQAYQTMQSFFGLDNVHGGFVHKDERHEYIDKNGQNKMSLEHMHTLVSAYTEEKGINGKAFETKARLRAFNKAIDDMCMKEFGIHLNTGEKPDRKSVERLKEETELRKEADILRGRIEELNRAEKEATERFLDSDTKATEAESRQLTAEKNAQSAEKRTMAAEQKLKETNAQYDEAAKGLKKVLDKKARASIIPTLSNLFGETVTYNKNTLEDTKAIGQEAYTDLKEANLKLQEAITVQQRAELKEQSIEPYYQKARLAYEQAEQERKNQIKIRQDMERQIEERAKAIANRKINEILDGASSSRERRLECFCEKIQINNDCTILDAFEEQEQILRKKLRGIDR